MVDNLGSFPKRIKNVRYLVLATTTGLALAACNSPTRIPFNNENLVFSGQPMQTTHTKVDDLYEFSRIRVPGVYINVDQGLTSRDRAVLQIELVHETAKFEDVNGKIFMCVSDSKGLPVEPFFKTASENGCDLVEKGKAREGMNGRKVGAWIGKFSVWRSQIGRFLEGFILGIAEKNGNNYTGAAFRQLVLMQTTSKRD